VSGSPEPRPNPAVVPIFATAAFLAGLVGLWGFTSLFLDRDVIDYPDAGLILGPSMAVAGCVVTFVGAWRVRRSPTPLLYGTLTALLAFAVILAIGAIGYSFVRGNFGVLPAAALHFGISPFMIGAALLCGIVVGGAGIVTRPRPARDR
jgi:hypothetical protein